MKSKEKKPMSLKRKILSVVLKSIIALLAVFIVAVTVFAVMFRDTFVNIVKNPALIPYIFDNWGSLSKGFNVSTEQLKDEEKANTDAQVKAFAEANINLTEEDIAILSGKDISEEERALIIYNAMTANGDFTSHNTSSEHENVAEDNPVKNEDAAETDSETGKNTEEASEVQKSDEADVSNSDKNPTDTVKDTPGKNGDADRNKASPNNTEQPESSGKVAEAPKGNGTEKDGKTDETSKPLPNLTASDNSPQKTPVSSNTKPSSGTSGNSGSGSGKMTEEQYNMRVSELVAKMYSIKADFLAQLSSFESRIISEYKALPSNQKTSATKSRIVSDNMNYIMGLEAQCDAQVLAVTTELNALMTANGKPTTLVDQINAAYSNEKEIKKAYYVSLYK